MDSFQKFIVIFAFFMFIYPTLAVLLFGALFIMTTSIKFALAVTAIVTILIIYYMITALGDRSTKKNKVDA